MSYLNSVTEFTDPIFRDNSYRDFDILFLSYFESKILINIGSLESLTITLRNPLQVCMIHEPGFLRMAVELSKIIQELRIYVLRKVGIGTIPELSCAK